MRKQTVFALTSALALAGCSGPLDTFYRTGEDVSRLKDDLLNCEVSALDKVPVAFQIRDRPGAFAGSFYCASPYSCIGGSWGGGIYSVDVNKELRTRVTDQCMTEKGYSATSIPKCPDAVAAQAPKGKTNVLPELTAASCVIRNSDGTFQIVNVE